MTIDIQIQGKTAEIIISNRFDSSSYIDFKYAYLPLIANNLIQSIEVDVGGLEYMDSAALGMLMQLDEKAKNAGKSIALVAVPSQILKVLKTANAGQLFNVNLPYGMKLNLRS